MNKSDLQKIREAITSAVDYFNGRDVRSPAHKICNELVSQLDTIDRLMAESETPKASERGKTMRLNEKHIQWLTHLADGPKERKGWWQYPIQCARAGLTKFVDPSAGDWREELTDLGREKLSERQPNT